MNNLALILEHEQWFQQLIEDCKDIITEKEFSARWELVEGWHSVGMRILEDEANFTKGGYTLDGVVATVATSLGRKQRSIEYAIKFARTYPDLNMFPGGKNVSWHQICNKYLPKPSERQKEEYVLCVRCGSELIPLKMKCEHCGIEFEFRKDMIRRR